MTAQLWRLNWGGRVFDANSGGTAIEEWSNTVSLLSTGLIDLTGVTTSVVGLVMTYHTSASSRIDPTVACEFIKLNQFDITTGLQITDPTNVRYAASANRGGASSSERKPLSTSAKVTIDNGTRDRRARGGWYTPRSGIVINANGRFDSASITALLGTTRTLLQGLNGITDGHWTVGVWSKAGASFTPSTRLRVGDVPDNVRRRRNELVEVYAENTI